MCLTQPSLWTLHFAYYLLGLCPAQTVGLVLYPATLAPATGSVTVTTQCADNAYNTTSLLVSCDSSGNWSDVPKCECDDKNELIFDNGRQTCRTESI